MYDTGRVVWNYVNSPGEGFAMCLGQGLWKKTSYEIALFEDIETSKKKMALSSKPSDSIAQDFAL